MSRDEDRMQDVNNLFKIRLEYINSLHPPQRCESHMLKEIEKVAI